MNIQTRSGVRQRRMLGLALAAGFAFTLSLAGSALKSTMQVYFATMAGDFSVGVAAFAWSTTTFAIVIALASPVVGALADRFSGGAVLVMGTVLAGVGFLTCALSPGVVLFAPLYGVVGAVAFTMLSYVPLGKLADELFAGRGEGLAYAIMTNGPAVGFVVLVPLWVWLGTFVSWRVVFVGAAVVMLAVMTPLAVVVRRLAIVDPADPATAPTLPYTFRDRLGTAVRNRGFVLVAAAFTGCGVTMAFVDVHMVADMDMAGMQPPVITGSLILLGILEIIGGLVAGRMCDRGAIKRTLMVGYALRGGAMLLLAFTPTIATSLLFGAVFGGSYMVTVVATTLWVARLVPPHSRGTAMGLVWTLHGLGAALSSQVGAFVAQSTNTYNMVSLGEGVIVLLSLALVATVRDPAIPVVTADAARV